MGRGSYRATSGSTTTRWAGRPLRREGQELALQGHAHSGEGEGPRPSLRPFDSSYTVLDNLKLVRSLGWRWFARIKSNRLVDPDDRGNAPVSSVEIPSEGRTAPLREYGFVKVFRTFSTNGDVEYWATDGLEMNEETREKVRDQGGASGSTTGASNSAVASRGPR
ncbi:MAG: hypothetical protein QW334_00765 [Thermofilum sp.]